MRHILFLALAASFVGAGSAEAGTIKGRVTYNGDAPEPAKIDLGEHAAKCRGKGSIVDESVLVSGKGGVANTVIIIEGVATQKAKPSKATLKQNQVHLVLPIEAIKIDPGNRLLDHSESPNPVRPRPGPDLVQEVIIAMIPEPGCHHGRRTKELLEISLLQLFEALNHPFLRPCFDSAQEDQASQGSDDQDGSIHGSH